MKSEGVLDIIEKINPDDIKLIVAGGKSRIYTEYKDIHIPIKLINIIVGDKKRLASIEEGGVHLYELKPKKVEFRGFEFGELVVDVYL